MGGLVMSSHRHVYGLAEFKLVNDDNVYGASRIDSDVNGNPRYVVHYRFIAPTYEEALRIARQVGGKKYKAKWYGGGIVFTTYDIQGILKDVVVNYEGQAYESW